MLDKLAALALETVRKIDSLKLKMTLRQIGLMIVGAVEDDLGIPRSVLPKHKRNRMD